MESKKINQLATNVNPQTSDLTTIGDPITGQLKKITWLQVAHLIGAQASVTLQQVTDNGNETTDPIITGGLTLSNLSDGVLKTNSYGLVGTYGYGLANGVATLDSGGKIPAAQLPSSVMEYKGTWNASTNTPTLADGTGDNGDVYLVNVAGSQNLGSGTISFAVGDWVVYNGTIWQKSLNSNAVSSVFGRTGTITAQEGDYNIDQLGDVAITSAASNDYLRYNGTGWVNTPFPTFVSSDKLIITVRNNSGATINKGTVVYINGATAGYPTIAKAQANADSTSAQTIGMVQDNISNNSNGYVVIVGQITGLDTSAYSAGTQLYLSGATAGAVTSTKPYAPTHLVYIGIVSTSNAVNGVIEIKVQNGYELDEIHDVSAQNPSNNDGIFFNTATSLWEKKSIATVLGYTPEQPLTFSSPLSRSTNTISIPVATSSANGYLSSTDWTTFNNKLTSPMTTLGDIIYGGASGAATRLAGNTTTAKQYLSQTGTGTVSAAPAWATITGSDITGAALTKSDDTNVTLTLGGTPATALLRAASLTLGWTGQLAVSRGGTGAASFTANQVLYGNGTSAISSSSTFIYNPTAQFSISNTATTGLIGVDILSTVNALANNDIVYGMRINPTFSVGSFTGVTQRALGVFGNVYINGNITGAGWQGAVIGSSYGGAGTVSGIMKANGSGTVSAASAGTDYQAPITLTTTGTSGAATFSSNTLNIPQYQAALTNPVTGVGNTSTLAYFTGNTTINGTSSSDNRYIKYGSNTLTLKVNDNSNTIPIILENTYGYGYGVGMIFNLGYDGAGTSIGTAIAGGRILVNPETSWTSTASTQDSNMVLYVAENGVLGDGLKINSNKSVNLFGVLSGTSASFSSTVSGYAMSITNVEDSSQGLLVRATDNDTTLYLAGFQSSVGATSQTWVNRFMIAKSGNAILGDGIPYTNVRFYIKSENQLASNYALYIEDGSGQDIAWFRNDKTIRFYGSLTGTTALFNGSAQPLAIEGTANAELRITRPSTSYGAGLGLYTSTTHNWLIGTAWGETSSNFVIYNAGTGTQSFKINYSSNDATFSSSVTAGRGIFSVTQGTSSVQFKITSSSINNTIVADFVSSGDVSYAYLSTKIIDNNTVNRHRGQLSFFVRKDNASYNEALTISDSGTSTFLSSVLTNSPSEGATGEGLIAGRSFKIDGTGTSQTAKMYMVSNTLSDTYGSGLTLQAANFAGDKAFGFNLSTAGNFQLYTKTTGGSFALGLVQLASGNILIGMPSSSLSDNGWSLQTAGGGHTSFQISNNEAFIYNNRTTGTTYEIDFRTNTVERGKISVTDSGVTYGTGSDYRIKEDFRSFNGMDILKNIKVYDFLFKETKERSFGVIAHELQEVLPIAVYGQKDWVREDGTMKIQQVDYSKIVPILIKSIQEHQLEIEYLKSKIA